MSVNGQGSADLGWSNTWQQLGGGSNQAEVVITPSYEENGAVQLFATEVFGASIEREWSDIVPVVRVDVYVYITPGAQMQGQVVNSTPTGQINNRVAGAFQIQDTGAISVFNEATNQFIATGMDALPDQWNEYSLIVDTTTSSFEFAFNNQVFDAGHAIGFANPLNYVNGINLEALGTLTTYIGPVTVSSASTVPTINPVATQTTPENAAVQALGLTGITLAETITATSSNPGLIPNPTITFTPDAATATLNYAPASNMLGGATITLTLDNYFNETTSETFVIDVGTPPMSAVAALPARTSLTSFSVSWSGIAGTGGPITGYNLSVSTDEEAFASWLANTPLTSSTFTAALGHTYGFTSQALDQAGDLEPAHSTPDATVSVTATPWQNPGNPLNVLGLNPATILPADALAVIDYLNLHPDDSSLPATAPAGSDYYDVLGQNNVVPADALAVIDYLNLHPAVDVVAAAAAPADVAAAESAQPAVVSNIASSTAVQTAAAMDAGLVGMNFAASASYGPPPLNPAVVAVSSLSVAPAANAALISDAELGTSSSTQPFLPSGDIPPSSELARLTAKQQVADWLFADPSWWEE